MNNHPYYGSDPEQGVMDPNEYAYNAGVYGQSVDEYEKTQFVQSAANAQSTPMVYAQPSQQVVYAQPTPSPVVYNVTPVVQAAPQTAKPKKKLNPVGMILGVPGLIFSIFAFNIAVIMTVPMVIFIINTVNTMEYFSYANLSIFDAAILTESFTDFYTVSYYSVILIAVSFVLSLISRFFMSNKISNTGLAFSIISFIILAFPWIAYQVAI